MGTSTQANVQTHGGNGGGHQFDSANFAFTDRDEIRFARVEKELEKSVGRGAGPFYDSVVIAGAGFTASIMAARLARSEQFHGKVVLAGPRATESRMMKDGATLRGYGTDYLCYALGVPQNEYVAGLYGDIVDGRGIGTRNISAMAKKGASGEYGFSRVGAWQGGTTGFSRPLFYGARNSRMQGAIHELMNRDGVIEVPDTITSIDQAYDLAPGKRPLVVNAGHNPRLLGANVPTVDWATVAVQAPLKIGAGGIKHIGSNAALLAPVRRGNRMDVGLFNPYADPLSPNSSFYGIIVVEVYPGRDGYNKQRELDIITEELFGISSAIGLEVDDPEETLYAGQIPGSPWKAPSSQPGTLELQMIAHPGVSATFSDGMTSGALAAVAAAEAVLRGVDPDASARRAVKALNWDRRLWNLTRNKIARPADLLVRAAPEVAIFYPHTVHGASLWASAA